MAKGFRAEYQHTLTQGSGPVEQQLQEAGIAMVCKALLQDLAHIVSVRPSSGFLRGVTVVNAVPSLAMGPLGLQKDGYAVYVQTSKLWT